MPAQSPPGLAPVEPVTPAAPTTVPRGSRRSSVQDAVRRKLEAARLVDTWEAAQALDMAGWIDEGSSKGSALAALHKELRATMTAALRGVDDPATRVGGMRNELAERRARRAGGAG